MPKFDYEAAKKSGYSDEEIGEYLTKTRQDFDVTSALKSGYSLGEVADHLNQMEPKETKEERSSLEKAGRVAGQYALGVAEGTPVGLAFDIGVGAASKGLNPLIKSEQAGADIEFIAEKNAGKPFEEWSKPDQDFYNNAVNQVDPRNQQNQHPDISIRGIAEKATGLDLKPEGIIEKSAQWAGFIRDPRKIFELGKTGITKKDVLKAISPTSKEVLRGAGAGIALQAAEEGDLGPIGTLAAAVIGDVSGNIAKAGLKGAAKIIKNPREAIAEAASKFTAADKKNIQKQLIDDFRKSGVQADIGTITDNNLLKWMQSRLAQSSLTGKPLDELKNTMTKQVLDEYKALTDSFGQARFTSAYEAGEATKDFIKDLRETDLKETRELYKKADQSIKKDAFVDSRGISKKLEEIEKALSPGNIKSSEQSSVLSLIDKMKRDISDSQGNLLKGKVKDLMNDKIALNEIINYEVQGGSKQLLKGLVADIDRAIISYGKDNPTFAKNYIQANKRFSNHAKTFRNKRISKMLGEGDVANLINRLDSVQGIRELEDILKKTKGGSDLMNNLKRFKIDEMIQKNLVDSSTNQLKSGTFSKLLEKGKNREIAKELLPKGSYDRLVRLQKNAGHLAEATQKFLNTSKTAVTAADGAILIKLVTDLGAILNGNPFPLMKTGSVLLGSKKIANLIADPDFLKLTEDFILASQKNNTPMIERIGKDLLKYARVYEEEEK